MTTDTLLILSVVFLYVAVGIVVAKYVGPNKFDEDPRGWAMFWGALWPIYLFFNVLNFVYKVVSKLY